MVRNLGSTSVGAEVPWFFNAYDYGNGVTVAAPNCLACHGARFDGLGGALVIGMGDPYATNRLPSAGELGLLRATIENAYGSDSAEAAAFMPYFQGFSAVVGHTATPFLGPNVAFAIEESGFAHRDLESLQWRDEARFTVPSTALGVDVPPWWHLKKKHALYFNGMGRGDAARLSMQSSVVATPGMSHLQQVDEAMPDLLAFLISIEAPAYPATIDAALVEAGEALFVEHCASCHGTYGQGEETYPNLLVDVATVGTDPIYAEYLQASGNLVDSYNNSWFATGEPTSWMQPELGYVAPPLDGIWATAPYFHNGSVPTLAAVLDSTSRPGLWLRDYAEKRYDVAAPGLVYDVVEPGTADAYDTTVRGYGNGGHTFGDVLTPSERAAVVEYLKTL